MRMDDTNDKKGSALRAQRFQMLQDIAAELSGDLVFPTCFDVAVRLRRVLQNPDHSIDQVTAVVAVEPLISSKLLLVANSAAYNPAGSRVVDIKAAVIRLGLQTTRSIALGVAVKQLLLSKSMVAYSDIMVSLWNHSLQTASAAYVIARRLTRLNCDEALLAGLVHDMGAFYMLYRASQYDELRSRPETVKHLVEEWHESIGDIVLNALGLPDEVAEAARDHDQPRPIPETPRNLRDVIYVGSLLAGGNAQWLYQDAATAATRRGSVGEPYVALLEEIDGHTAAMRQAFS